MRFRHLLIEASAGSGKTYQLANRFLTLLALGIPPERILALTFTRLAAGEFADRILSRLAGAAGDRELAEALATDLKKTLPDVVEGLGDFPEALDQRRCQQLLDAVTRNLDRLSLGTLDSFFARIVRNFAYELGVAGFELLEEAALEEVRIDVLARILNQSASHRESDAFLEAFRGATMGQEENRLYRTLTTFTEEHHERYLLQRNEAAWGNPEKIWPTGLPAGEARYWELAPEIRDLLESASIQKGGKTVQNTFLKGVEWLEEKRPGVPAKKNPPSGVGHLLRLLPALSDQGFAIHESKTQRFEIEGPLAAKLAGLAGSWLREEVRNLVRRTQGVYGLLKKFESAYEVGVRRRGRLGFSDVKLVLSDGVSEALREQLNFRLDARFDHWLLDEFQDTSRKEWIGIHGLVDEVAQDAEGTRSLFVVGDTKQGIYGWRGGETRLMQDLRSYYGEALHSKPMDESWRSSQVILDLVNAVCDLRASPAGALFPEESLARWRFNRQVAAKEKPGWSRVLLIERGQEADWKKARLAGTLEVLLEERAWEKGATCAVLLRSGQRVLETADFLRKQGVPAEAVGDRSIAEDHPGGAVLLDLARWLHCPEDDFAWAHLQLSPLGRWLGERAAAWVTWQTCAQKEGLVAVLEKAMVPLLQAGRSEFTRQRLEAFLLGARAWEEANQGGSWRELVLFLENLKQREGGASGQVQVMTFHKAKGLGWDVVVLPDLDDCDAFDHGNHLKILEKKGKLGEIDQLLLPPSSIIYENQPVLSEWSEQWKADQCYENFCLLYVALTRAKHSLHVLLDSERTSQQNRRFGDWLRAALVREGKEGPGSELLWEKRQGDWLAEHGIAPAGEQREKPLRPLERPKERRKRRTPSQAKEKSPPAFGRKSGREFGSRVHAIFERIGWMDELRPERSGPEGQLVHDCLKVPEIGSLFDRAAYHAQAELRCEQAFDVVLDGQWVSGVIDRLIIEPDQVTIVDFKTDALESVAQLRERYAGQMKGYRRAMAKVLGRENDRMEVFLLSTHLKALIEVR
ncbi:MAG: UvrD-helicase domain-containing protein [Verrucomicrobiota bacterium]